MKHGRRNLRDVDFRNPKLNRHLRRTIASKKHRRNWSRIAPRYDYLEQERPTPVGYRGPRAFYGTLFKYARLLTRAIDEHAKPNDERIAAFRDSAKESLELELFSSEPVYDDYEILRLTDSLTDFAEKFGGNDPLVKKVLAGKSPHARAVELVSGTKLKDVEFRKKLYAKNAAAVQAAHDPMIDLARMIDGAGSGSTQSL